MDPMAGGVGDPDIAIAGFMMLQVESYDHARVVQGLSVIGHWIKD